MGSKEPRARSNVINEGCQCLTSTHQYVMWAAEVFALHEAGSIDPPGSDHIALPVWTLPVNTRAKALAFKLVAAIQKNRILMYENVLEKQQLCAGSKLSFKPPQHLQTSNYNVKHLAGVALNLFKQRQDQASVITFLKKLFFKLLKNNSILCVQTRESD